MLGCVWELLTLKLGWLFLGAFLSPGAPRTSPSHSIPSRSILLPGETRTPPWAASRSSFQVSDVADAASPKRQTPGLGGELLQGQLLLCHPWGCPLLCGAAKAVLALSPEFHGLQERENSNLWFKTQ